MPQLGNMVITRAAELGSGDMGPSPGPIYLPVMRAFVPTEPRVPIGTAPRFTPSKDSQTAPGPGAYQLPPAPRGPSFTVRSRTAAGSEFFSSAMGGPGPGAHPRVETAQTRKKNAAAYSMRSRPVPPGSTEPSPAPGHTQRIRPANEPVALSTKPNIPGVKFDRSKRPALCKPTTGDVGPGEYSIGNTRLIAGYPNPAAFTMKFRHPPLKRSTADAEFKLLPPVQKGPAFTLGASTKFCGFPR